MAGMKRKDFQEKALAFGVVEKLEIGVGVVGKLDNVHVDQTTEWVSWRFQELNFYSKKGRKLKRHLHT